MGLSSVAISDSDNNNTNLYSNSLPARCYEFYPKDLQLISVSDNFNIKLWDFHLCCYLLTYLGHADFIQTVWFHPKATDPSRRSSYHHYEYLLWIISASNDQTNCIWNYIKYSCLCAIGREQMDYIMLAEFHSTLDLILTASLDHTIWFLNTSHLKHMEHPTNTCITINTANNHHYTNCNHPSSVLLYPNPLAPPSNHHHQQKSVTLKFML